MINLSQETEALAKRLAAAQSLSDEDEALEARARDAGVLPEPQRRRDQSPAAITARRESLNRIGAEIAASWTILTPYDYCR